jgi:hypothetical protein
MWLANLFKHSFLKVNALKGKPAACFQPGELRANHWAMRSSCDRSPDLDGKIPGSWMGRGDLDGEP